MLSISGSAIVTRHCPPDLTRVVDRTLTQEKSGPLKAAVCLSIVICRFSRTHSEWLYAIVLGSMWAHLSMRGQNRNPAHWNSPHVFLENKHQSSGMPNLRQAEKNQKPHYDLPCYLVTSSCLRCGLKTFSAVPSMSLHACTPTCTCYTHV